MGDPTWDEWVDEARRLVEEMLADEENRRPIDERLYKEPRAKLLDATHRKCAYCELRLTPGQRHGDVEHYRPKGRARDLTGKVVKVQRHGQMVDHPGYYWLAYDHTNLLPSCQACNRRAMDAASGMNTGKSDLFPTLDGRWASRPEEVVDERPALLNPWLPQDDPADHLRFDAATGLMFGITERGQITVNVLGLNRDGLPEARLDACREVTRAVRTYAGDLVAGHDDPDTETLLNDVVSGAAEYAAFRQIAYLQALDRLEKLRAAANRLARPGG
jgi:hypothetical protein